MYVLLLFPEGVPGDWIGDGHAVVAGDPFIWVVAGHRGGNDRGGIEGCHGGGQNIKILSTQGGQLLNILHPRDGC